MSPVFLVCLAVIAAIVAVVMFTMRKRGTPQ